MARDKQAGRNVNWKLVGGIVLALVVVDFWAQNRHEVKVEFLFFEGRTRLWLLLLITSVVAVAAVELISSYIRRHRDD